MCFLSLRSHTTHSPQNRLRRRKAADRPSKQQKHKQQQQQQQSSNKEDAKQHDSWKTISRDDKSWHNYRSAVTEYWSDASVSGGKNEQQKGKSSRHGSEERRNMRNSESESSSSARKENKKQQSQIDSNNQKNEYENTRAMARNSNSERNGGGKFSSGEDHGSSNRGYNRRSEREEERSRYERREVETEDDEIEVEVDVEDEEEESYNASMEYRSDKYENKKYYDNNNGQDNRSDYRGDNDSKYENEKTSDSSSSPTSESEEERNVPETGRKVEQIAQKLEQTAQKYAREHSPPKFIERRSMDYKNSLERSHDDNKSSISTSYDNYEMRNTRSMQRQSSNERDRYTDKSSRQSTLTYDRDRSYEKNSQDRKTNRGFERPRPPSQEAPERPTEQPQRYRERTYSEKEDIYGDTSTMNFSNESILTDKDRGYESNFETKLERTKVLERHGFSRSRFNSNLNDTNNNTLKNDRKPMMPRQSSTLGHNPPQVVRNFDVDNKSPKLIKRTKSFWRFRRDSEVLEGMALWQHRSLVDIPKMLKKDAKEEKTKSREEPAKSSSEGSPDPSHRSLERKDSGSTITDERINGVDQSLQDEPKPAERMHLPEKPAMEYFDDLPTPAERPKMMDRNEYRSSRHQEEEEQRPYFVGNVSRKAILENERKRSLEAKRNMIVAELKENNQAKRNERRKKPYGDDDDGLMIQRYTETEASDEESTYSCIIVKDQAVSEKTLLPRTKLRRDSERGDRNKKTCGPWYDLWGVDQSVTKKKKKTKQQ